MRRKQIWFTLISISALVVLSISLLQTRGAAFEMMGEKKMEMTSQVSIDNFSFGPADLTVEVGTTVTWTNKDDIPHNVVSTDKLFASPVLDTDEQFSYTFSKAGVYKYYCSIHPKMTGKLTVK
jgi:plastocyanin